VCHLPVATEVKSCVPAAFCGACMRDRGITGGDSVFGDGSWIDLSGKCIFYHAIRIAEEIPNSTDLLPNSTCLLLLWRKWIILSRKKNP